MSLPHESVLEIVLSVRDGEKWHRSCMATIYKAMSSTPDPNDAEACAHRAMSRELILDRTFDGRMDDPVHAIQVYERHNQAVREGLPAHRLLVYETGSGWEPLCNFLDCPVPDEPYPRSNTSDEFQNRHLRTPNRA